MDDAPMTATERARLHEDAHKRAYAAWVLEVVARLDAVTAERDAAHAPLRESVPHIKRALAPYKDGWIEEKDDILARITAMIGERP